MSTNGPTYFQQAENALNKFRIFDKDKKWSEAAELFIKSGNSYKSICDWVHAGESYIKASECLEKSNKLDEAAITAADAGKMFSKQHETIDRALKSYMTSIRYYRENSKPLIAAQLLVEAGKIFLEQNEINESIKVYEEAAQIYEDENQPLRESQQLAIVADLYCSQKKFIESSDIYKKIAISRMNDRLTQLSSGEFCVKSIICRMEADDVVGAEKLMKEFVDLLPSWKKTREYSLLEDCIDAINNNDSQAFSNAVAEYDQFKPIDSWMTTNLLVVKNLIDEAEIDIIL